MNIRTGDGIDLFVRDWPLPNGVPRRATALIVHGLGEHCRRYAHVAAALNGIGVAVRGYDQRGFGQSGGPRAAIPTPNAYLDDLKLVFNALAADAQAAGDHVAPFLIGHSMGGLVAARAVTGGWVKPRGLVLSSPALKTWLNMPTRLLVTVMGYIAPNFLLPHGLPLHKLSHDPLILAEVTNDELCHAYATPRGLSFIIDAGARTRRDAKNLVVPTLLLVAGDDRLVDPAGAREFADAAPEGRCTFKLYPSLYHEIFNELELDRARVLEDLCGWINRQIKGGGA
jgi:alpha-beta hydrolase superfamily lysophospholipase